MPQQASFWAQYGIWIAIIVVIALVFIVLLTMQNANLRRLRAVQRTLGQRNQALHEAQNAMEADFTQQVQALEQRITQFRSAAIVARDAAAIRDVDSLMDTVVNLVAERFALYHAGIFLVDEVGDFAILRAVSSEGGRQMLARGHKLRVSEQGIVGYVAASGEPRIALDVDEDVVWSPTAELPDTRSEMALPLKARDRVIGVLDVQSAQPQAFTQEDVEILHIMADQLALAIQNARLFRENQRAVERLESLYRQQLAKVWQTQLDARAYAYDGFDIQAVSEVGKMPLETKVDSRKLVVPILLHNQVIGSVELERSAEQPPWSDADIQVVDAIRVQAGLALENAQLLAESRQRAARQQQLNDISRLFSRSMDMEAMLRAAARELGRLPGVLEAAVHLEAPQVASSEGADVEPVEIA